MITSALHCHSGLDPESLSVDATAIATNTPIHKSFHEVLRILAHLRLSGKIRSLASPDRYRDDHYHFITFAA